MGEGSITGYDAPLADIRFALHEAVEARSLATLPGAESLADRDLTDAILDEAARFASRVLAPLDAVGDRQGARWSEQGVITSPGFQSAYRQFIEAGWNRIDMPAEYGGQGLPNVLCCAVHEMFHAANKAFCMCPDLAAPAVHALCAAAAEPLRSLYVPRLVSGEWSATMNLTEPQAGSDVGALSTRAELQADGSYRLFGQKSFISFGEHDLTDNILHLVLARIGGAPAGTRGISLFAVPKLLPDGGRNDVRCTGIENKLGNHGSPTCTLVYGASGQGATGWLIGEPNKGLQAMFVMMNGARFNVGVEAIGVAERAYQKAVAYARLRVQGTLPGGDGRQVPIIRHPDVRRMLLTMRSQIEAMRAVAYWIAAARDEVAHHPNPVARRERLAFLELMVPVFKGWTSETAVEIASTCIQVHGGAGYVEDYGATQALRDVRVTTIYEGTTAIQARDLVDRKLARDGGAAFEAWAQEVRGTLGEISRGDPSELTTLGELLGRAFGALEGAVRSVLAQYREHPLQVLAGSVPLLRAFGIVAGGWQMARAAMVADRSLRERRGDLAFMRSKSSCAMFYATHVLPQAWALAESSMRGGKSVLSMDEAAF